jgi:guanine nucleotide-binding protein subunit alpha
MRDEDLHLPHIGSDLLELKERLTPLLKTEDILIKRLTTAGSGEVEATQFVSGIPIYERQRQFIGEVAVNSLTPWKDIFTKFLPGRNSFDSSLAVDWQDPNDPGRILYECAGDMKKLWNHETIQELLEKQNLRLEEMAGL